MLVVKFRAMCERGRTQDPEAGVALVLVVIVMLVGFVIASTIAASVLFTISANQGNKGRTQAFIAAESGRDVMRQRLAAANAAGNCTIATLSTPVNTQYSATAKTTPNDTVTGFSDPSLTAVCPGSSTHRVVIQSTGKGSDGSTSTILSVYNWQVVPHNSPGGTMGGYTGFFHGVGGGHSGSYTGDLVVRSGDFICSSTNSVNGDLWVLGGADGTTSANVTLSGGCTIAGSIYAFGTVKTSGGNGTNPIVVGKSIVARGGITMDSNGVSIGTLCTVADGTSCGQIASGAAVNLTNTGGVGTIVGTVTGSTVPSISSNWKHPDNSPVVGAVGPSPTFTPPLNSSQNGGLIPGTVYGMTTWIDLGAATSWGTGVTRLTCPSNASNALAAATGPLVLDYSGSGCSATSGQTTTISLAGGAVPHDAAILVGPGKTMKIQINGNLTSSTSSPSQLFFVHEDTNTGDSAPDCGQPSGDSFKNGNGSSSYTINPLIMLYTPCGLDGTWTGDLTGQIYVGGGMTYSGNFVCQPMSWLPTPSPMPSMDCRILGSGGASGSTTYTQTLGGLVTQVEQ